MTVLQFSIAFILYIALIEHLLFNWVILRKTCSFNNKLLNSLVTFLLVVLRSMNLSNHGGTMNSLIPLTYISSFLFIYYGSRSGSYTILTVMLNYMLIQISMIFSFDVLYIYNSYIISTNILFWGSILDIIFFLAFLYVLYRLDAHFQIYFLLNKLSNPLRVIIAIFCVIFSSVALLQAIQTNLNHMIYWFYNVILLLLFLMFIGGIYSITQITRYFHEINQLNIAYSQEIEKLDDMKEFRHDYKNLLLTLTISLKSNKTDEAFHLLEEITSYSDNIIEDNVLKDLKHIYILPVKSILFTKIQDSINKKIDIQLCVIGEIKEIGINLLDFVRILSILIDNAIESSQEAIQPAITIKFIQNNKELLVEIENIYSENNDFSLEKILKKGITTKSGHNGLGLSYLAKIADRYPNFNFIIDRSKGTFRVMVKIISS